MRQEHHNAHRIGILCHGAGSGSTRAAIDLACALSRLGESVLLITLGAPRWKVPACVAHQVIAKQGLPRGVEAQWNRAQVGRLATELGQACAAHGLRILHYHYGFPFAEACALMQSTPVQRRPAIVATLHGSDIMRAAACGDMHLRLKAALGQADAITSVSPDYVERVEGLTGRSCRLVPNFLPDERRQERLQRLPGREPVIVHVSSFRQVKRVQQVGQAFLALRRSLPCRLLLAGEGPCRPALQHLLRPCGKAVQFLGYLDDPLPVIRRADAMLLASEHESFSIAALEAMASGIPVVAPRLEGLSDTVRDGEGGLLFTPGRPQHAAARLLRLFGSPHHYRRLARSADEASRRYEDSRTVNAYRAIYDGLAPA